jgi:hypothetical protein
MVTTPVFAKGFSSALVWTQNLKNKLPADVSRTCMLTRVNGWRLKS